MMMTVLLLIVTLAAVTNGDVTNTNLTVGDCLCLNTDAAVIRSSACGDVIGSAVSGDCFTYNGLRLQCPLEGKQEFLQIKWNDMDGWLCGVDLDLAPKSSCKDGLADAAGGEYRCEVRASGKRIHETKRHTKYDCMDKRCRNTCKGGQCVAYVTCSCKRNGKWAPYTGCWRPGRKVKVNGKCNRNIASNTAIATFNSQGRYFAGHAAVFIRCKDDNNILVYDQGCCRGIGYTTYSSSHRYFSAFATITNPSCSDRSSWPCRVENGGSTCCPVSSPGCKRPSNWWEAMKYGKEEEILL